jgi:hypothetical protein
MIGNAVVPLPCIVLDPYFLGSYIIFANPDSRHALLTILSGLKLIHVKLNFNQLW